MFKKTQNSETPQEESMVVLLINLSLFIMLLAFFIVLNRHTEFREEKVRPILESIDQTFTSRVFRQDSGPSYRQDIERQTAQGDDLEKIEALFRSRLPQVDARYLPSRGILYVEMPVQVFQNLIDQKSPRYERALDDAMRDIMSSRKPALQLEIWLVHKEDPVSLMQKNPDQLSQLIKQLSDWVGSLEQQTAGDLPKGRAVIGVGQADQEIIKLIFRPHTPYAPLPEVVKDSTGSGVAP
jgi:hypothetical protein